ncbi:SAYSvFN domain-containing protein 1 [Balamuthia mandrillaris]
MRLGTAAEHNESLWASSLRLHVNLLYSWFILQGIRALAPRPRTWIGLFLWAALYYWFIQLEFGVVYFLFSCFLFVWLTLGSGGNVTPDGRRVSAYSVFNENMAALPGTFDANEFEQHLRGGGLVGGAPTTAPPRARPERMGGGAGHRLGSTDQQHAQMQEEEEAVHAQRLERIRMTTHAAEQRERAIKAKQKERPKQPQPQQRNEEGRKQTATTTRTRGVQSDLQALLQDLHKGK